MRAQVEALAARGEPDVSLLTERGGDIVWPAVQTRSEVFNAQAGAVAFAETPDALALTCWLNKDAMIAKLDGLIMAEADDAAALTDTDRQLRTAEVMGDLLACERDEAALTWRAVAEELPVWFRADISPLAVLGVRLVTNTPNGSPPTTSPLVWDLIRR